jgi:hypothetical protein
MAMARRSVRTLALTATVNFLQDRQEMHRPALFPLSYMAS